MKFLILLMATALASASGARDLQAEIDALSAQGGGTLVLKEGVYETGALFFKPGVNLHLEKGAVIKGLDNDEAYPKIETRMEGETCVYYPALVNADHCDGFKISGEGVIDGNGYATWKAFWDVRKKKRNCLNKEPGLVRPRVLYVSNSKNVDISGVTFKNSKFWTTHYYRCENVVVHDCEIIAEIIDDVRGPSTDAIDIDVCKNFTVRNVIMNVNDDSVVIKGGKGPWADDPEKHPENGASENVLIENCVFKSVCHSCLTLGSECVGAKNITIRNCRLEGAGNLLYLKFRPDTPQHFYDITVDNVKGECNTFLHFNNWKQFFSLGDRTDPANPPMSYATNITMKNCDVKCSKYRPKMKSTDTYKIKNFRFENNIINGEKMPDETLPRSGDFRSAGWEWPKEIGNYNVQLTLGDSSEDTVSYVKFMGRRLAIDRTELAAGEKKTVEFTARVPGPYTCRKGDDGNRSLKIEVFVQGGADEVAEPVVTPAPETPTIYLCGDSTVTDQGSEPWASWGQMLPAFVKKGWSCSNFARSGLALATFSGEGRLKRIMEHFKAGDWVIIQFGHNDQKRPEDTPREGYTRRLNEYVDTVKAAGGNVVLVTSCERRRFTDGRHDGHTLRDYAEAMIDVAKAHDIPFIDLNKMSYEMQDVMGEKGSAELQVMNRGKLDNTHHNVYGAYENARIVAAGLAKIPVIGDAIRDEYREFDHTKPDAKPGIPPSGKVDYTKPEGS